ncbi:MULTISPECIES: YqzE family protein [Alkalihalophilus]|uniref:YqzE family protein n=3 Tax=Alkalihalophilus TaxID=2893060 RepID=D3FUY3_ALKPO|nr:MULTISPECIES: YqzE family protein [Alkalihalophilus]ADC48409.1 hypothetical protein BpOF4_01705 [Alkalihalophilus pseudofirmus OF4]ERN53051.1 hypothetical protein A33I_13890 [Alkalihalophilus marmarensis DSM 21297]MCM3489046.1 YqzE family protein [Alkalihalophilus marmarensis]MDV2885584.1 YqzE family protein [Alkalihalophilus pseudofirmus]MEC2073801.1 YqzE family protein [Alkalihalophilus marmarensis]
MSLNEYIKFITQQLVLRLDQPKEVRKQEREARKAERPPFAYRTFGIIPFAISLLFKRKSKKQL